MTFRTKILLALIVIGVAPALAMSALSYGANRDELIAAVGGAQREVVTEAAHSVERSLQQVVDDLRRAVDYIPFAELGTEQLQSVLAIPFRQMPSLETLAVLDEHGNGVIPPLARSAGHPLQLSQFADRIPLTTALHDGVAISAPWTRAPGEAPHLAVAVRIDLPDGTASESHARVLAAEVSLASVVTRLDELAGSDRVVALMGPDDAPLAVSHGSSAAAKPLEPSELRRLTGSSGTTQAQLQLLHASNGAEWLAASAPVSKMGGTLVLAQPGDMALGAAQRVARYIGYWAAIALALTIVLGLFVSRGISQPVQALTRAADALRAGNYDQRATVRSRDELGRLATTFNAMAEEIDRRDREIRAFNEELQQRVEQKTAELQQARDQIDRSRRLEALASMGAGLSHEMNNPLTSVMGILALLREDAGVDSRNAPLLAVALNDAERIAAIVERFRRMVESDLEAAVRFDVTAAVRQAIAEVDPEIGKSRITVGTDLPSGPVHVLGDPRQFAEAIRQLLLNAAQAMPEGGSVQVQLSQPDRNALKLIVSDSGTGIPREFRERVFDPFFTTKRQGGRLGLGLTLAHRVIQELHGRILLDSDVGRGTTVTVLLPAAGGGAHLR